MTGMIRCILRTVPNNYHKPLSTLFLRNHHASNIANNKSISTLIDNMLKHNPYAKKVTSNPYRKSSVAATNVGAQRLASSTSTSTSADPINGLSQRQKRTERPWENSTSENNRNNHHQTFVRTIKSSTERLTTNNHPVEKAKATSVDPFDSDESFDWESALLEIDAATDAELERRNHNPKRSDVQQLHSELNPPSPGISVASTNTSSPSIAKENRLNNPYAKSVNRNGSINRPPPRKPQASSSSVPKEKTSNRTLPPRPPTTSTSVPPSHATLSSLRPDSWTNKNSSASRPESPFTKASPGRKASPARRSAPPSPSFAPPFGDERQIGLPKKLQFRPDTIGPVDDGLESELIQKAELDEPLLNDWTLKRHQKVAVRKALAQRRSIMALDMGLGKTLIGCVFAKAMLRTEALQCTKAIVICPVSMQEEWKRTAKNATGLVSCGSTGPKKERKKKKKTKKKAPEETNADNDESDLEEGPPQVWVHSWGKVPEAPKENFIVIADEAHSIQSMTTNRTQSTLQLCADSGCVGVLLLTGTPMKNGKPCNLFPLLKAVGHPLGKDQRAYDTRFCNGRNIPYGRGGKPIWQNDGATNLDQLNSLIDSHLLHMTKKEVLDEQVTKTRILEHVPVSSRMQLKYNQELQSLAKLYKEMQRMDESVLGALQRVRQMGSLGKVDATVQYARQVLENEPAVVIFTSFVKVAEKIHQKLEESGYEGELLSGETPQAKRQAMVDNFQEGLKPVFVCTFGAGGVGLTLTAACTVILVDRDWSREFEWMLRTLNANVKMVLSPFLEINNSFCSW